MNAAKITVEKSNTQIGIDDEERPASALADVLDEKGAWDWSDGSEHEPSDRLGVINSSSVYWLIYRGTGDEAQRFASEEEAQAALHKRLEEMGD